MSTLTEIETAAEALPPEEKEELFHFLSVRLCPNRENQRRARLVEGPDGTLLLEAPPNAPLMTTERVKQLLDP